MPTKNFVPMEKLHLWKSLRLANIGLSSVGV
jgi:hypothetical protein